MIISINSTTLVYRVGYFPSEFLSDDDEQTIPKAKKGKKTAALPRSDVQVYVVTTVN